MVAAREGALEAHRGLSFTSILTDGWERHSRSSASSLQIRLLGGQKHPVANGFGVTCGGCVSAVPPAGYPGAEPDVDKAEL